MMADDVQVDDEVPVAQATPLFPPRPDAIATLITSDDFLPGAQTLLYSVKKSLSKSSTQVYPPELIVLVTPNISKSTRDTLYPTYCTRIIEVEPISFPSVSIENKQITASHVSSWSNQGALTKLSIFRLDNYDVILYLDADCLVVKDVSHLLDLGKIYQQSEALIAAAPDIMPPDKFNAGVMVIRPNKAVFDNMMQQRSLLATYDGGDTGFLNAYFPEWYSDMPPFARLKFGYNAQRFLYHCTYEKQPNYWDLGVAPHLHIVHYSSTPKPWESKPPALNDSDSMTAMSTLEEDDVKRLRHVARAEELEALWWKWFTKSKNFIRTYVKERAAQEENDDNAFLAAREKVAKSQPPKTPKEAHKLIAARYKELRTEGKDAKEAMSVSRREYGLDRENASAASQVAAMFGLR